MDADGTPYVPVGDGGIVLGLALGDSVFALDGDHAAPGACLTHPNEAARHALAAYSLHRQRGGRAQRARCRGQGSGASESAAKPAG